MTVRDLGRTGLLSGALRRIVVVAAVVALAPYLVLKVLWLAGSRIGMVPGVASHMGDARMQIGNVITVGLAVCGVAVVLALVSRWGRRLPWWTVVLPAAVATGALAPIALGLPLGALLQAVIRGDVSSGGEGDLLPGVFFVVYGGFAVYGIALAILFADYVQRRWSAVLDAGPVPPRTGWGRALPAAALGLFAATTVSWAFAPPSAGLAGWESIAQRTVLVVVGLLTVVGGVALLWRGSSMPRERWAAGWIGCCTAAVQGPTLLLLANEAVIDPLLLAVTLVATPAAAWLGLSALRRSATAA
jgi:hypothetical protein